MKYLFTKISPFFARLAIWRKPSAPPAEEPPAITPDPVPETPDVSTDTNIAAPKVGWLARLKQVLSWRRRKAPPEPPLDFDQTVVVERPSAEQLAATQNTDADTGVKDESTPQPNLKQRILALMHNKRVLISAAGTLAIALVTSVTMLFVSAAREKDKLKAELLEVKKKLAGPVVVIREIPVPVAMPTTPIKNLEDTKIVVGTPNKPRNKAKLAGGECLVTDKDSVGQSLKDCIENFNNLASNPRRTDKKH